MLVYLHVLELFTNDLRLANARCLGSVIIEQSSNIQQNIQKNFGQSHKQCIVVEG